MRVFLVAGSLEVDAVCAVKQRALGQVARHAKWGSLPQGITVECDANALGPDRGVAKVDYGITRCMGRLQCAAQDGQSRGPTQCDAASGSQDALHELAPSARC